MVVVLGVTYAVVVFCDVRNQDLKYRMFELKQLLLCFSYQQHVVHIELTQQVQRLPKENEVLQNYCMEHIDMLYLVYHDFCFEKILVYDLFSEMVLQHIQSLLTDLMTVQWMDYDECFLVSYS